MPTTPNSNDPQKSSPKVPPIPEMIGATSAPFYLGKATTQTSFAIKAPTGPTLLRSDTGMRRLYLKIESITSTERAPSFDLYLNVPPGDEPQKHSELFADSLSMFGLVEASLSTERHPDSGLNIVVEVTELFTRLRAMRNFDPKTLRVSFVPTEWEDTIDVRVGRVSLTIE